MNNPNFLDFLKIGRPPFKKVVFSEYKEGNLITYISNNKITVFRIEEIYVPKKAEEGGMGYIKGNCIIPHEEPCYIINRNLDINHHLLYWAWKDFDADDMPDLSYISKRIDEANGRDYS